MERDGRSGLCRSCATYLILLLLTSSSQSHALEVLSLPLLPSA